MFNALHVHGARQNGAGQEGTQSRGKAQSRGYPNHPKTNAQGNHQQHFIIQQTVYLVQKGRQQINAQNQPQRQIEQKLTDCHQQAHTTNALALRHGG